ncbi:MAG: hypothetical protein IKN14_05035 [Clostridiales bacterium]|nr:hypothetical protein [Clostridiales bacterium]
MMDIKVSNTRSYMTTRALVFMASCIMSFCAAFTASGSVRTMLIFSWEITSFVFIWSLTLRFFLSPALKYLSVFFNVAIVSSTLVNENTSCGGASLMVLLPVAVGLAALSSSTEEGRVYFRRADVIGEVILPFILSIPASAASCLLMCLAPERIYSVTVILSGVFCALLSYVISKVRGVPLFFTSKKIDGYEDMPGMEHRNIAEFIFVRVLLLIATLLMLVASAVIKHLMLTGVIPDIPLLFPGVGILVFSVFVLIFFKTHLREKYGAHLVPFESIAAVVIGAYHFISFKGLYTIEFEIADPLILLIVFIACDMVLTGALLTYKRRRITAPDAGSFKGIPLMLIYAGLFLMVVDAFRMMI